MQKLIALAMLAACGAAQAEDDLSFGLKTSIHQGVQQAMLRNMDISSTSISPSLTWRITDRKAPLNIELGAGFSFGSGVSVKAPAIEHWDKLSVYEQFNFAGTPHGFSFTLPGQTFDLVGRIYYPFTADNKWSLQVEGSAQIPLSGPVKAKFDDGNQYTVEGSDGVRGTVYFGLRYDMSPKLGMYAGYGWQYVPGLRINIPCGFTCPNTEIGELSVGGFTAGVTGHF